ncbi:MAG: NAD-dependent epimerase/dehydratase family protein [Candidatus Korobacteraceae bacterium]
MPSSKAIRTALLTGAGGFTGRYLQRALQRSDYQVACLDPSGPELCDLTNPEAVEKFVLRTQPDVVVHLAGIAFVGHGDAEDFYRVNVLGTLNLLQALAKLERAPDRIVIASSANVYGAPDLAVLDESLCPAPVNHYACSKLAMEHMVRPWFSRFPILIVRPFNYTGPGQSESFLVPKIVKHFKERAPHIELGNLQVSRDYSDVEDVTAAYMALLESDAHSDVVNICSGRAIALLDIISMMNEIAGYTIEVRVNPEFVRDNEVLRLSGNPAKLRSLVDLPAPRPFSETLRRMYET